MELENFTFDANGMTIKGNELKTLPNGDQIQRLSFTNGFIWIQTNTPNGTKRMDFSHELTRQPNGAYKPDMTKKKHDFKDYY